MSASRHIRLHLEITESHAHHGVYRPESNWWVHLRRFNIQQALRRSLEEEPNLHIKCFDCISEELVWSLKCLQTAEKSPQITALQSASAGHEVDMLNLNYKREVGSFSQTSFYNQSRPLMASIENVLFHIGFSFQNQILLPGHNTLKSMAWSWIAMWEKRRLSENEREVFKAGWWHGVCTVQVHRMDWI